MFFLSLHLLCFAISINPDLFFFFSASSSLLVLTRSVCRNPRVTGFYRFSAVHTGSRRFNCITDPIAGPNRLPLRFPVQPVRPVGPVRFLKHCFSFISLPCSQKKLLTHRASILSYPSAKPNGCFFGSSKFSYFFKFKFKFIRRK